MSDARFPIPAQLGQAFARVSEALLGRSGDPLGDGLSVVCRASFRVLRPACTPWEGYIRTVERDGGTGVGICVKLVDRRGDITMNGILEWIQVGADPSPRRQR